MVRGSNFTADAVVLALGGGSWPRLGSDGRWTDLLAAAGIEVLPLSTLERRRRNRLVAADRRAFCGHAAEAHRGELRLAHPARRSHRHPQPASKAAPSTRCRRHCARCSAREAAASLLLDLRPDIEPDALAARIAGARKGDSRSNMLRKTAQLTPAAIAILRDATGNDLPADPAALAALIKAVPLRVDGLMDLERAISSAGGIAGHEIDPHFMVRKLPGVFVAGEMIDWDAPTGGYLLQASMATGFSAGRGVVDYLGGGREARLHAK